MASGATRGSPHTKAGVISEAGVVKNKIKRTPPLGIEPRTCRLTADRSANGALKAVLEARGSQCAGAAGSWMWLSVLLGAWAIGLVV